MEKHILILTADAGFGHRSAANAVAAALRELQGADCVVDIVNPMEDSRVPALLRSTQTDYDRLVREMPKLYQLGYDASDALVPSAIVEQALTLMLFEVIHDILRRYVPDVIVSTYPLYQAALSAAMALTGRRVPTATVVTDLATVHRIWFHERTDFYMVPTPDVQKLALEFGFPPHRILITGIPVHPSLAKREREQAEIRAELGWRPDLTTLLVAGSKRVEGITEVLRVLNHSGLPIQMAIVAGGDTEQYARLLETDWHVPTYLFNYVVNMPTLMQAADCILCKAGGLIVTESLASGLPILLVGAIAGQETGNAEYVVRGGAGELAKDPIEAMEILFHWLEADGRLLAERAARARALGRPIAAYDVAEAVWALAVGEGVKIRRRMPGISTLIDLLNRNGVSWKDREPQEGSGQE
ncbi:MAG: MGDG synthase family glycosyltransferase [Anaerolineae bacterium]